MRLLLQLVYEDGTVCKFPAGGQIETELTEAIVDELVSPAIETALSEVSEAVIAKTIERGVRFRSQQHIEDDMRIAISQVLKQPTRLELKTAVKLLLLNFKKHSLKIVNNDSLVK